MLKKYKKCLSQFLRAQCNVLKLLLSSKQQPKAQRFPIYYSKLYKRSSKFLQLEAKPAIF